MKQKALSSNENSKKNRKPYKSPELIEYGSIEDLTASGSVDRPEGTGTGNRNKRP